MAENVVQRPKTAAASPTAKGKTGGTNKDKKDEETLNDTIFDRLKSSETGKRLHLTVSSRPWKRISS